MIETIFPTNIGNLQLIINQEKIVYCNWIDPACEKKLSKIRCLLPQVKIEDSFVKVSVVDHRLEIPKQEDIRDVELMQEAICQLQEYFSGNRRQFYLPLAFMGTSFQNEVWKELSRIPYGKKITYGELSKRIGRSNSQRAVAGACGANPLAIIIPCHRVVGQNGKIGGYTGGIAKKEYLLCLESGLY